MAPIHDGARAGDLSEVKRLIQANPTLLEAQLEEEIIMDEEEHAIGRTSTPLIVATAYNYEEMVEWLLNEGANVEARNARGVTALLYATFGGYVALVTLLLSRGADVNYREGRDRFNALMVASERGHLALVRLLLNHEGINVNLQDTDGDTALYISCVEGHTAIIEALLEKGAYPTLAGDDNFTPLMHASFKGHLKMVSLLLNHEAYEQVNLQDRFGITALYISCWKGYTAITNALLEKGADQSIVKDENTTPLMIASQEGHLEVVRLLLHHGGIKQIDCRSSHGQTALYLSCRRGDPDITEALLAKGADPTIAINTGQPPLIIAHCNRDQETTHLLETALAEPQRVRLLYKARCINDGTHAIQTAYEEAKFRGERVRKSIAAAPAYLKTRVKEKKRLPVVKVREKKGRREANEQEEIRAEVLKHILMEGKLVKEIFTDLVDMVLLRWDEERKRT